MFNVTAPGLNATVTTMDQLASVLPDPTETLHVEILSRAGVELLRDNLTALLSTMDEDGVVVTSVSSQF